MHDDFSLAGYQSLIGELIARGYQVRGYDDAEPKQLHVILRHDLDMSLQAALPIAEIEHQLGLKGHYFVLMRTEMYNPCSARAAQAIGHLQRLGHEIGLHLDASLYGNEESAVEAGAQAESVILEQIAGAPVRFISFHRPAKALIGRAGALAGRQHAYEPRFFSEMGYCSDSRGAWHYGHPLDHPALRDRRALQLLTHPIWWISGGVDGLAAKLEQFVGERADLLRQELAANCEPYRETLANLSRE